MLAIVIKRYLRDAGIRTKLLFDIAAAVELLLPVERARTLDDETQTAANADTPCEVGEALKRVRLIAPGATGLGSANPSR